MQQIPRNELPPHVAMLLDLREKAHVLYSRDLSKRLVTIPRLSGATWDLLVSRSLVEPVRYRAPTGDAPAEEFEAMTITRAGHDLLGAFNL